MLSLSPSFSVPLRFSSAVPTFSVQCRSQNVSPPSSCCLFPVTHAHTHTYTHRRTRAHAGAHVNNKKTTQFAQVLLSLELFLLSPYVRRHVYRCSLLTHVGLTAVMVAAAAALLFSASPAAAASYGIAVVAVTFMVPGALVRAHKFKAHISGPWDEAAPHIPRELVRLSAVHPLKPRPAQQQQ
ncbi:hypothetical protein VaNZ11_006701 [Volvox africanus]|uniref:Transmembrane protein n=1 Tax=Volvox africanus TaxID=51714 RepID=A0ABQ5S2K1_9CHLO|nr:hypothetical protein VaNZ11_006701 [Volvox africanus]